MQQRMTALMASLLIGGVWARVALHPAMASGTLARLDRVVEFDYRRASDFDDLGVQQLGRSVLLATVFHASENASWQSFPNRGSHYDPAIHAVVLWSVSCVMS